MIDLKSLPCLRKHFEKAAAAEQEAAATKEPIVEYARAPAGPGYQPRTKPSTIKRSNP